MMAAVSPQRTSEIEKVALSAAITTSQAATTPVPPPKQPPCTSATVGTGSRLRRSTASAVARLTRTFSSAEAALTLLIHLRSAPAWKCRPLPLSTTTRSSGCLPSSSMAVEQARDHVAVVGVADLRPVERDAGDAASIEAPQYGLVGHGRGLRLGGRRRARDGATA